MLKKDSQRRTTLRLVFRDDGKQICEQWMKNIVHDLGSTLLTMVQISNLESIHKTMTFFNVYLIYFHTLFMFRFMTYTVIIF